MSSNAPIHPPSFWLYQRPEALGGSDQWVGIHMSFRFTTPWRWRGPEFGWVHINAMISPWWGRTRTVDPEHALQFILELPSSGGGPIDVFRISENSDGELANAGLSDQVLANVGLSRTGLVAPSEFGEPIPLGIDEESLKNAVAATASKVDRDENTTQGTVETPGQVKLPSEVFEFVRETEKQLGISIENCTAIVDGSDVDLAVLGELSSKGNIDRDFEVVAAVYDYSGDLIAEESAVFLGGNLGSFDTFKITAFGLLSTPVKIKVFPRAFN